jgi:hypothetical protein
MRIIPLAAAAMILAGTAGAETLFEGDWSRSVAVGGAGAWRYRHTMRPDSMRIENDPTRRARVARFIVRPGDNVGGWSGERAEVAIMQDRNGKLLSVTPSSGREFYGLSVKIPPGWQPPERNRLGETWGMVFQLHGPDELKAPPSLSLEVLGDFQIGLHGGALLPSRTPRAYRLSDGALNPGRWVEFLLDVKWSADDQGWVVVWRRDEGGDFRKVLDLANIANLQYGFDQPIGEHYWKAGFYRSEGRSTHEVWLGPVVRGSDRDAVAKAAFGRK